MKPEGSRNGYYRSLEELENSPQFQELLEREFPDQDPQTISPFTRRRFLQLMGASLALAGAQSCRWEKEDILPFTDRPDGRMPGVPSHYATSFELGGVAQPLLVTNYDGRPIKIEGNAEHPASGGATTAFAQGSVLGLYDPDRSRSPSRRGPDGLHQDVEFAAIEGLFDDKLAPLRAAQGQGLAILAEASSSPTLAAQKTALLEAMPEARWVEYESAGRDQVVAGARMAFGQPVRTHYQLDDAKIIFALDEDLTRDHPDALRHARAWARHRNPEKGEMNRLYCVESTFSSTGSVADHRLPLRSDQGLDFLLALEARLQALAAGKASSPRPKALSGKKAETFFDALADDLHENQGASLVCVGARQGAQAHAVGHRINALLANAGKTLFYTEEPSTGGMSDLSDLTADMKAGKVQMLLILGGNPVYDAPVDLGFSAALKKVSTSVHLSEYRDETSHLATWHVNRAHYLESWGDARSFDGTICLIQPQILPIFGGKMPLEIMALTLGQKDQSALDIVLAAAEKYFGSVEDFDRAWRKALHDGFVAGSAFAPVTPGLRSFTAQGQGSSPDALAVNGKLELVFLTDSRLYDGRFANNGWLQETPDFITKLTWDNAALLDIETAEDLGIENNTLVELSVGGRKLEVAAYVLPGQAKGSVGLFLGFGRREAGQVGGSVEQDVVAPGFDAGSLRSSASPWVAAGLKVEAKHTAFRLATTQDHWAIDKVGFEARQGRIGELVREGTLAEFEHDKSFATEHDPELFDLWKRPDVAEGHAWGMSVDLGKCVGCNACVIGCTAENNVPVVGKERVIENRELHWIRIDRYFAGDAMDPRVVHQPLACQQCENAPCEEVCPVAATTHSREGLNDMVYNRCVGTRYCANNCPYKVRRFNFFDFNKDLDDPKNALRKMGKNPEVTVRWRGVMEKCTFCVQRIQHGKIAAKREGNRPIRDGEIVTACQQACPTEAIHFGDLKDSGSKVAQAHKSPRAYALLGQLNISPRNRYLAQIRNPHAALAKLDSAMKSAMNRAMKAEVNKAEKQHDKH